MPEVCTNKSKDYDIGNIQKDNNDHYRILKAFLIFFNIFAILIIVKLTCWKICYSVCIKVWRAAAVLALIIDIFGIILRERFIWNVWRGVGERLRYIVISLFVVFIKLLVCGTCLPELIEGGDDYDEYDYVHKNACNEAEEVTLANSVPYSVIIILSPRQYPIKSV